MFNNPSILKKIWIDQIIFHNNTYCIILITANILSYHIGIGIMQLNDTENILVQIKKIEQIINV